jgi:hypothetical protein
MFEEEDNEPAIADIRLDDIEAAQHGGAMKHDQTGTTSNHDGHELPQRTFHIVCRTHPHHPALCVRPSRVPFATVD